jgi:hypothetical protein
MSNKFSMIELRRVAPYFGFQPELRLAPPLQTLTLHLKDICLSICYRMVHHKSRQVFVPKFCFQCSLLRHSYVMGSGHVIETKDAPFDMINP